MLEEGTLAWEQGPGKGLRRGGRGSKGHSRTCLPGLQTPGAWSLKVMGLVALGEGGTQETPGAPAFPEVGSSLKPAAD